jgi:hypothetical protein
MIMIDRPREPTNYRLGLPFVAFKFLFQNFKFTTFWEFSPCKSESSICSAELAAALVSRSLSNRFGSMLLNFCCVLSFFSVVGVA